MNVTHGIVTDTHVVYYATVKGCLQWVQQPINPTSLTSVGDYIDLANKHQLTQLWILPGTALSDAFSGYDDQFVTSSLDQYRVFPKELDSYLTGRHTDRAGKEVTLVVPAYIKGLPFSVTHMHDAKAMYAYVTYMQSVVGVPFTRDAKGTGVQLLYQVNNNAERRGTTQGTGYLRPVQSDLTPFYDNLQVDLSWSRPLQPEEVAKKFLHVIDVNLMWLAATSGLHVGSGNYQHIQGMPFNKKQPGLWLASLSGVTAFNTGLLPPMFPTGSYQDTAMVQAAIDSGYNVTIHDAYIFPEVHTTFNPWYVCLRDGIAALQTDTKRYRNVEATKAAVDTLKMMYRQTIGLMGRRPEKNETAKWYNRPDLYNAVVGDGKRRMYRRLLALHDANVAVVGVYVDAIYIVSDQPLDQTLPDSIVISDQIGKFKRVGSYPLADVAPMITSNPQTLVQGLAKYRKEAALNG